jgi:hypothetical protein
LVRTQTFQIKRFLDQIRNNAIIIHIACKFYHPLAQFRYLTIRGARLACPFAHHVITGESRTGLGTSLGEGHPAGSTHLRVTILRCVCHATLWNYSGSSMTWWHGVKHYLYDAHVTHIHFENYDLPTLFIWYTYFENYTFTNFIHMVHKHQI